MPERLEREEQLEQFPAGHTVTEQAKADLETIAAEEQLDPETQALVQRCMEGTEPYGRELKFWEPKAFSPVNIMSVMLAAAGFRAVQIAEIQGIEQQRISVILRHPYGRKILHAMMNRQGGRVLDIKTMLEEYASDLLDKVAGLALAKEQVDLELVSKVGFGLLDRAGYGVTQKIESRSASVAVTASEPIIQRFTQALEESRRIDKDIMPAWVPPAPPAEDRSVGTSESVPSAREQEGTPTSELDPRAGGDGALRLIARKLG